MCGIIGIVGKSEVASALYDVSPWGALLREGAWLAGLTAISAGLARLGMRRLLA